MRSPFVFIISLAAVGCAVVTPLRGRQLPQITGESLTGKQISLPSATAGSVAILCIGFSHASQSQVRPWTERATSEFRRTGRVTVYAVAVLEDAPRFVRGVAVHGMKSNVPRQQQDRFMVVYHGEKELKRITGFQEPKEAYILLLDPKGEIQWLGHGPVNDAAFQRLIDRVHSILALSTGAALGTSGVHMQ